jgi:hypothetical protein
VCDRRPISKPRRAASAGCGASTTWSSSRCAASHAGRSREAACTRVRPPDRRHSASGRGWIVRAPARPAAIRAPGAVLRRPRSPVIATAGRPRPGRRRGTRRRVRSRACQRLPAPAELGRGTCPGRHGKPAGQHRPGLQRHPRGDVPRRAPLRPRGPRQRGGDRRQRPNRCGGWRGRIYDRGVGRARRRNGAGPVRRRPAKTR